MTNPMTNVEMNAPLWIYIILKKGKKKKKKRPVTETLREKAGYDK